MTTAHQIFQYIVYFLIILYSTFGLAAKLTAPLWLKLFLRLGSVAMMMWAILELLKVQY